MECHSFILQAVTINTPAKEARGILLMYGESRNIEASRPIAWMMPVRRVCCPLLIATEVRAMAAVAGIPPKKGLWGCPSGFVETGETPEEACLRELWEEAGVTGSVVRVVRVARLQDDELYGDMLAVSYLVTVTGGEPAAGDEVDDVRYCDAVELPAYLARSLQDVVQELRKGN